MTEAHEPNEIDGPHEGPIKTPKQLILAVLYAFVVPIFGIILLVMYVTSGQAAGGGQRRVRSQGGGRAHPSGRHGRGQGRLRPRVAEDRRAGLRRAVHGLPHAGALGAPKLGDADAWAPRIKTGFDALLHSALAGKGQMPPQGGGDFSDFEIARAVVYMANKAGAKFAEPAAPSAAASGAAATTTTASVAPMPDPNAGKPTRPDRGPQRAGARRAAERRARQPPRRRSPRRPPTAAAPPPLYAQTCAVCHATGVAGAPKLGDKAAWAPRIAAGRRRR